MRVRRYTAIRERRARQRVERPAWYWWVSIFFGMFALWCRVYQPSTLAFLDAFALALFGSRAVLWWVWWAAVGAHVVEALYVCMNKPASPLAVSRPRD